MSKAHAPNGLLVDPIYAKMRYVETPISIVPPPDFEPPQAPSTALNTPPTAVSAFDPAATLATLALNPEYAVSASDGAIDLFLLPLLETDGNYSTLPSPLPSKNFTLNLSSVLSPNVHMLVGVAMHDFDARIQSSYAVLLASPSEEYMLVDSSGKKGHYNFAYKDSGEEIEAGTTNNPNGTTTQTLFPVNTNGKWSLEAPLNTAEPIDPKVETELTITRRYWEPYTDITQDRGLLHTGVTSMQGDELIIEGPIPSAYQDGATYTLEDIYGQTTETGTLTYDEDDDILTATITAQTLFPFLRISAQ